LIFQAFTPCPETEEATSVITGLTVYL